MAGLLAAVMAAVTLYCLARALLPAVRAPDHGRDLDGWHAVMAAAMVAMLLLTWTRATSVVALVVFVAGLGWATSHAVRRAGRAAYLRLALGCAAMAAMLLPAATASAAPVADAGTQPTAGMAGMADMPGMDHAAHTHATSTADAGLVPPTVVLGALLVALGLLLVVRLLGSLRAATPVIARLDACCDVAMAAAMGYMLVLML